MRAGPPVGMPFVRNREAGRIFFHHGLHTSASRAALRTMLKPAPLIAALALCATSASASAQARWKEIGKTSSGAPVSFDTRSVHRKNGVISSIVRVRFAQPVDMTEGRMTSVRAWAMFDCARNAIAAKQNVYYIDEAKGRVGKKTVNKEPGFGPALKGTFGDVALEYFCRK